MIKEVLFFVLFLFGVIIPVIPVCLYHLVKGVVSEVAQWFGR